MTLNRDRLMDVLEKAHKGPIIKQFDWDTRTIPGAIADKLKKYGLQKTCRSGQSHQPEPEAHGSLLRGCLEVATEVGMLCTDTRPRSATRGRS